MSAPLLEVPLASAYIRVPLVLSVSIIGWIIHKAVLRHILVNGAIREKKPYNYRIVNFMLGNHNTEAQSNNREKLKKCQEKLGLQVRANVSSGIDLQ